MENQKSLWAIFHGYDEDGGFGDAIPEETMVGVVEATEEEINAFVKKWDKPVIYDRPYSDLYCHNVWASRIEIAPLDQLKPYGEDDYYGQRAKRFKYDSEFERQHGERWWIHDEDRSLRKIYYEGLEKIENEGGTPE